MYVTPLETAWPPGLESPLLYMGAVFFLLLGVLLTLEWLWRLTWAFFERPAPFKTPATAIRVTLVVLLLAALVRVVPQLWLFMRWPQLSPTERSDLYALAAQGEIVAVIFFSFAWLFALLAEPMIKYQLEKEPLPLHLWPTKEQMKRPLKIGAGAFAIAFALTYLG